MDTFPIWRTTWYDSGEESVTFRILKWGTDEIYRARAVRYPDEAVLRINLNKPCQNALDSRITPNPDMSDYTASSNAYAEFELQVLSSGLWRTVYAFAFFNDWSYEGYDGRECFSEPINGHAAPNQTVPCSYLVTGGTQTKCFE